MFTANPRRQCQNARGEIHKRRRKLNNFPRRRRDDTDLHSSAEGVRSPHICRGRPAAGSQRADSLGSCATPVASVGLSRASISSVGIRQTARLVLTYLFVRVERDGSRWPAHLVANLSRSTRALHRSPRRRLRLRRLLPRVHASTRPTQHCVDSTLRPVTLVRPLACHL